MKKTKNDNVIFNNKSINKKKKITEYSDFFILSLIILMMSGFSYLTIVRPIV